MKRILGASCAVLVLVTLAPAQALANPQHERMKRCNAEAKEQALKGDARKADQAREALAARRAWLDQVRGVQS